jgi:hypothetical protein
MNVRYLMLSFHSCSFIQVLYDFISLLENMLTGYLGSII